MALISVIFCNSYGGFGLSDAARAEYERRRKLAPVSRPGCDAESEQAAFWEEETCSSCRDDPLLVDIACELGAKAAGPCCTFGIAEVEAKYLDCLTFREYDGKETPDYDLNQHKLAQIAKICALSEGGSDEQLGQIRKILALTRPPPPKIYSVAEYSEKRRIEKICAKAPAT